MKQSLRIFFLFFVIYFPLNAMEITEKPNTPKYDRARDCFTTQPLSLIHQSSKQVAQNISEYFGQINGETVDAFASEFNAEFTTLPIELRPLVEQQTLIEAAKRGYIGDYSKNKLQDPDWKFMYGVRSYGFRVTIRKKIFNENGNQAVALQHLDFDSVVFDCHLSSNEQLLAIALHNGNIQFFKNDNNIFNSLSATQQKADNCENHVARFVDHQTCLSWINNSPEKIDIWHIADNGNLTRTEEPLEFTVGDIESSCKEFLLFLDTKKTLWGCHKNNNGKYLQKITSLESLHDLHDVFEAKNKQLIALSNPNSLTIRVIANIDGSLTLIKKISLKSAPTKFPRYYIRSFENGILTFEHADKSPIYEHTSIDIDTEKIVNNIELEYGFEPMLNPPLNAIFASIAGANSHIDQKLH